MKDSPDSFLYTDHFDYLSDSDLEDEDPAEYGEQELARNAQGSASAVPPVTTSGCPPPPSQDVSEVESRYKSAPNPANPSKLPH